jgi:hypothetical protein
VFTTSHCAHTIATNRYPPKTTIMAPPGGQFGLQQCPDDNMTASDNNAGKTLSKDTPFGRPTNQYLPPPGYRYSPSQLRFPGTSKVYHPAQFNMTPCSQPSSGGAPQEDPSYGPSWQGYNFPQRGYGGPQMCSPQQFTEQRPSSPVALRVPPVLAGNIPVNCPTSSSCTPYGQIPGAPGRPPISLPK